MDLRDLSPPPHQASGFCEDSPTRDVSRGACLWRPLCFQSLARCEIVLIFDVCVDVMRSVCDGDAHYDKKMIYRSGKNPGLLDIWTSQLRQDSSTHNQRPCGILPLSVNNSNDKKHMKVKPQDVWQV